ncbi:MAG: hypothetical protein AW08_00278 [Candidatus Accumulibacter adjunctus]|uniref:Uncharacterized protein n=1 Tax=Candidatus Accumulibacter adjunctus TaxID=1454001 RepID=A0A011NYR8_9PROT|nr:MAG: hypothetical protein AW08_00278 [Candidatus Accumulibacter adjunctus]
MHGDHVAAADQLATDDATLEELGVLADDDDRAETHQEDDVEEVADDSRCVEHRFPRFLGVADGEEAHQDVRQAGGTEHQAEAERDGGDRVGEQAAGRHQSGAELVHGLDLGQQLGEREAELRVGEEQRQRATGEQQASLDDLHPGRRDHAAESDIDHHQDADDEDRDVVVEAEEQLDQLPGANHLGDQVEDDHDQRRDRRHRPHRSLVEPVRGDVGEGETAEIAQSLRHQEEDDRPAREEGEHVDVGVVALAVGHRRQPKQRRCRHVVAGDRQAVLEAGDAAAGGVEVSGRLGAAGRPLGDEQRQRHEDQEHDDRVPVGRLLGCRLDCRRGVRQAGDAGEGQGCQGARDHFPSFCASLISSWVRSSNSPLARRT